MSAGNEQSIYNIVYLSHTFMGGPFVVGSHHLAREMARLKHNVVHISTPVTPAHLWGLLDQAKGGRFATWWRGGVSKAPRLVDYVPLTPMPWPIARTVVGSGKNPYLICVPSIRKILMRFGLSSVDLLYVDQPRFAGLEQTIRPKVTVYRATDLYEEMEDDPAMGIVEHRMIKAADGLVGTSQPVLSALRGQAPQKPHLLLINGVEYEHFSKKIGPPPEYKDIGHPRLVYVGALDERFDFAALRILAWQLPRANIVLIGPIDKRVTRTANAFPNVYTLGTRPYSSLPAYLQHAVLGLLPLSDHPGNVGRSPMKLFEYAAAGLKVVARETPVTTAVEELSFLHVYNSREEIGRVTTEALAADSDQPSIQSQVLSQSWSVKAEALLRFSVELLAEKGSWREWSSGRWKTWRICKFSRM